MPFPCKRFRSQKLGMQFFIPVLFPGMGNTIVILSNTKAGNKIGNERLKFVHTKIDIMHLLEKSIKNSQCVLDDDKAGADAEEQG